MNTTFQNSYDHLIQLSDAAFKNSENQALIEAELQTEWAAKSEAYQYAAQLFADTCYINGIPVETKIPLREQTIEQDRHESIEADVRNELTLTETE